jgi:hypothetical protein
VLDTKIQNLTSAVEQGAVNIPSIIALLAERQQERNALVAAIGSAETLHQIHVDRAAIEAKVQKKVADSRGLLSARSWTRGRCCGKCWKRRCDSLLTARRIASPRRSRRVS